MTEQNRNLFAPEALPVSIHLSMEFDCLCIHRSKVLRPLFIASPPDSSVCELHRDLSACSIAQLPGGRLT